MKKMIYKHKHRILLLFAFSICLSFFSVAQMPVQDTVLAGTEEIQSIVFGEQPSWMVTGSISKVNGDVLQKSFNTNLANALNGQIPGLGVMLGGGEAGYDSPRLLSRGISTFTSNNLLVIVDGFEGVLEELVPDEIETVSLLKDASATAMYGSRAANGVLLVTTKRGKKGSLNVSLNLKQGFQSAVQLPEFLGSYDYARLYNEALVNDGMPEEYTAEDLAAYQSGNDPYFHPDVDWYSELLRKRAPISNYDLNFSGGSETVRYFMLLNVLKSNGLYKETGDLSENSTNSKYSRYNFRSNLDIDLTNSLMATLNLAGSVEDKANPSNITTYGVFNQMAKIAPNTFPVYNPNGSYGGSDIYSNPLGDILESGFYTSNARTLQATFKMTQKLDVLLTKGLSVSAAISFNNYYRGYSLKAREYARYALSKDDDGEPSYKMIGKNTSLNGGEGGGDQWRQFALQSIISYKRTFGQHYFDGILMVGSDNYLNRVGSVSTINSFPYKHNNVGGRLTYAYNNKYVAEVSFAVNGSENFPKDKRYGLFPAASIGWVASNEEFLKDNNFVTFLKLRGSYGIVGNDVIGGARYMFTPVYGYTAGYHFGDQNNSVYGIAQNSYPNNNVTWEKSKKTNFGIEATLAENIDIVLDIFNEERYDILAKPYANVPGYLGIPLPYLNVGEVSNKGFEATLRYSSSKDKDFQYVIEGNVWYSKDELKYFSERPKLYDWMYRAGSSTVQPFGYESLGLFQDQADIDNSPVQSFSESVQPGDIKYRDMNGDMVIDQLDVHAIGKPSLPDLMYSMKISLEYKGFDLNAFFQGVTGRMISLSGMNYEAFQNDGKVGSIALDRWTEETKNTATYPRLSSVNNQNNFGTYSSFWQRNGNFLKLRSLELGYTIPDATVERIGMKSVRIFVNGTNLFSLDKLEYSDPEIVSGYPAVKTVSLGTRIKF
jgi:TonB-linked SusC/RagA family outer membrane protein